ncbi:hypothetical protein K2173_025283 [Erythroxylum novogranatense]|uniref:Glycosyl transferase CAP10 domain-containing protein n=1 Tax=Erythroxylum novogranatense TaxID=1862640 RepID=A0AAV8UIL8_9ROSI|nr:hypothetical protein K2173_025283 [Erythroxylum novogranatense]
MLKNNLQRHRCSFWYGSSSWLHRHFLKITWVHVSKAITILVTFLVFVFLGVLIYVGRFDTAVFGTFLPVKQGQELLCATSNLTKQNLQQQSNATCPSYFRWIHEDLKPWKETGITRSTLERARKTAHFRLVIVDGKAYVKKYRKSIQTRDVFTLWGVLQLLRLHPARLPDLELMFDCDDRPVVQSKDYFQGPKARPPPLFRYCSDQRSLDIVFPDWSFWGWAETNIKPWKGVMKDIKEGNKRIKWKDRVPYAYWRGNPHVTPTRQDLLKCNVSEKHDWSTRLYVQDWERESTSGYKQSNLEYQCSHRYKIYIEGWAWSVSEKYTLACDAMTLYVTSPYYDFYIREMVPLKHYWPIKDDTKCTSLQFAVDWGNNHTKEEMS